LFIHQFYFAGNDFLSADDGNFLRDKTIMTGNKDATIAIITVATENIKIMSV